MLIRKLRTGRSKTKKIQIWLGEVALFCMSQWVACVPAWWILYHVTVSCKWSIDSQYGSLTRERSTLRRKTSLMFWLLNTAYVWNELCYIRFFGLRRQLEYAWFLSLEFACVPPEHSAASTYKQFVRTKIFWGNPLTQAFLIRLKPCPLQSEPIEIYQTLWSDNQETNEGLHSIKSGCWPSRKKLKW